MRRDSKEIANDSEELFDGLGEFLGSGAWTLDLVSRKLRWSASMRLIHGVAPDFQPTFETSIAFYPPEARGAISDALAEAMNDGRPWDLELPLLRADGLQIWVRAVGMATINDGTPTGLRGALQDVTVRVAEREALRGANERLVLATEAGGVGIWDWDVVSNRLVWDTKMYQLYGKRPGQGTETVETWTGCLHPDDRASATQALQDAVSGIGLFKTEFRVIWDDGSVHHIRGSGSVTRDAAGHALRMVGTNWDTTDKKLIVAERVERELERINVGAKLERATEKAREASERVSLVQREKERFRAAVEAVQGVLWTNDAAGRMIGEQPGWAALTGQNLQEYEGYGWASAVHPDDSQPTLNAWNEAVAEKKMFEFEHRVRRYDGCWRTFAIRAVPLFEPYDSTIREWVGVHTDITDQRRAEADLRHVASELETRVEARTAELERLATDLASARDVAEHANRAKTRFLAGMSHELRTPLNGILGYTRLLRFDGGLNEKQNARVEAMLAAGNHLLEMITAILDLSAIEADQLVMTFAPVDLRDIASQCLDVVGSGAESKGLTLNLTVARGLPATITTDPIRLRQVLLNLIGNAVKFTQAGVVEVRLRPLSARGTVRIEVADTGPGVDPEKQARLFQEFARMTRDAGTEVEGAGLGLSISARLVALMNGKLGYEPNRGGGSVFWVELPVVHALSAPVVAEPARPTASPGRRLRILVVDDVAMNCEIAQSFLAAAGHEVTCVDNGLTAVRFAETQDFDVILMDVRMPEMDGLEATKRIRALPSPRAHVPIVALTAQAFAEQVTECRAAGMNSHLGKPFNPEALLNAVAAAAEPKQEAVIEIGADVQRAPIFDVGIFESLAAGIRPERMEAMLASVVKRMLALREALGGIETSELPTATIHDEAHKLLAGAGMVGLARLSAAARQFDHAASTGSADLSRHAKVLEDIIKATLIELGSEPFITMAPIRNVLIPS